MGPETWLWRWRPSPLRRRLDRVEAWTLPVVAAFLLGHGLLHLVGLAPQSRPPQGKPPPFDPGHSWMRTAVHAAERASRAASVTLAPTTAVLYLIAAGSVAAAADSWPVAAAFAATSGLVLKAGWFDPWLTVAVLLDVGVLVEIGGSWPAFLC